MQPLISVGAYNLLRLPQLIDELTELIGNKVQLNIVYNREWHFSNLNCQDRIKVKSELEKRHECIYIEADPGDTLFFHANLLHSSESNKSNDTRKQE